MTEQRDGASCDAAACEARLLEVERAIGARRYLVASEHELSDAVEDTLVQAGIEASREHALPGAGRADFYVAPGLVVELKVGGSLGALTHQVSRYAAHPAVGAVLVVSLRSMHGALPERLSGKLLRVLALGVRGL